MTVEFEQEIFPCSKEERPSSNVWADTSKDCMCSVPYTSQGLDSSLKPVTNGVKNRGSPCPSSSGQWPGGGSKNVKNCECGCVWCVLGADGRELESNTLQTQTHYALFSPSPFVMPVDLMCFVKVSGPCSV